MTVMAVATTTLPVAPVYAAGPAADKTDEAKRLYNEGKTHYDIGEYEKALDLWKQAYTKLDDSPELQTVRHTLVYNILEAEIRVYEVSKDVTHLRRAKSLLETYLKKHNEIYEDTAEASEERTNTEARLAEVERMLAEADANAPAAPSMVPSGEGGTQQAGPEKAGPPDLGQAKMDRLHEIQTNPALKKKDRMYKGFIVGGAVGMGVGGGLMIAGGVIGLGNAVEQTVDEFGNPVGVDSGGGGLDGSGAAVAGTGLLLTGAGLGFLVAGVILRKKLRKPRTISSVSPFRGYGSYGMSATLRF
jgi:tetratricopeptide (TPR) repeat protein